MFTDRKRHCIFCGELLRTKHVEGRQRLFCQACNRPIYENPVPATCMVVVSESRQVLLVQRNVPPKEGQWCLPGGFIELGESPEAGALRELVEETGLNGKINTLLGVVTTPSAQYHSVLMVGYLATEYSGQVTPGDDAADARWFEYPRLPTIAFSSHRWFMQRFFQPEKAHIPFAVSAEPDTMP